MRELSARCRGSSGRCSYARGQAHEVCSGRVAAEAAIYPLKLCRAILRGFEKQLEVEGLMVEGVVGMDVTEDQWRPATEAEVAAFMGEKVYKDALTGQTLPPALVEEARKREHQQACGTCDLEKKRTALWARRPYR